MLQQTLIEFVPLGTKSLAFTAMEKVRLNRLGASNWQQSFGQIREQPLARQGIIVRDWQVTVAAPI